MTLKDKLRDASKYMGNVISPFSFKETALALAIASGLGIGSYYTINHKYESKSANNQSNYSESNNGETYLAQLQTRSDVLDSKITELKKEVAAKPKSNTKVKNNVINNKPKPVKKYLKINNKPRTQTKIEPVISDGYNLEAQFIPNISNVADYQTFSSNEDINWYNFDLPRVNSSWALRIKPNDSSEYFVGEPLIKLTDNYGNSFSLEDYFNIENNKGYLNGTKLNSVFLPVKGLIKYSELIQKGAKLTISAKVKNKKGSIEDETLEILIGGVNRNI